LRKQYVAENYSANLTGPHTGPIRATLP